MRRLCFELRGHVLFQMWCELGVLYGGCFARHRSFLPLDVLNWGPSGDTADLERSPYSPGLLHSQLHLLKAGHCRAQPGFPLPVTWELSPGSSPSQGSPLGDRFSLLPDASSSDTGFRLLLSSTEFASQGHTVTHGDTSTNGPPSLSAGIASWHVTPRPAMSGVALGRPWEMLTPPLKPALSTGNFIASCLHRAVPRHGHFH